MVAAHNGILMRTSGAAVCGRRPGSGLRMVACAVSALLFAAPLNAQTHPAGTGEPEFADVGGVRLEYFQFGTSGTPVILVQDFHDYFHEEAAYSQEWIDLLTGLGSTYRLVASVRRGWGESDDPGYGYDVPSQAEDVLGLMDALDMPRAVLIGRTAATQEMTWIAEHHPERVMALAYLGTPLGHLPPSGSDPEIRQFYGMYSRTSCDIGAGAEVDRRLSPRAAWRPDFNRDPNRRIALPALLVLHPVSDRISRESRRIDRIEAWAPDDFGNDEGWCDDEAKTYFTQLRQDTARLNALRLKFSGVNELTRTQDAMRRAFEGHLEIVWEDEASSESGMDQLIQIFREFIDGLERAR